LVIGLTPIGAYANSESLGLENAVTLLSGKPAASLDGWIASGAIVLGLVLTLLYLRGMYLVLHYASETYSVSIDAVDDAEYSSRSERRLLYIGSLLLVILSALVISSYGFGGFLLYAGPVLSLLGPVVIIVSMTIDVRKCRRALGEHRKETANAGAASELSVGQESA
jgi:branched-subunit amino acid permease